MLKVGINGFGRIGRIAFRIALLKHTNEIEVAAVNSSGSIDTAGGAHLVTYDTMYRRFGVDVKSEEVKDPEATTDADPQIGNLIVNGKKNPGLAQKDPAKIPWSKFGVEGVIEATGRFTTA